MRKTYFSVVALSIILGILLSNGSREIAQPVSTPKENKTGITMAKTIELDAQPLPTLQPAGYPAQDIPERVYCGSPAQRNWKAIDVQNAAIGRALASQRGWTGTEWTDLLELWSCESSWQTVSPNTEDSGSYGIPQSLPASKMATFGADYLTNPETQIKWGLDYIARNYGSPSVALEHHYTHNWY